MLDAGKPVIASDLARGTRVTASSTAPGSATGNVDGGDDFIGVNGKARYLRLKIAAGESYGLRSMEVAGQWMADANLLGGRSYTVTPAPDPSWPDSASESTDGVLADAFGDGRSYGFTDGQPHAEVTFDLGRARTVGRARIHAYEEYPGYRPTQVTVLTSADGVNYEQQGSLRETNDQSRIWYELRFAPAAARYVKVSLDKTYTTDDTAMFVDEMQAYSR